MNCLNQCIIEGTVCSTPRIATSCTPAMCNFNIRVDRHYKTTDGDDATESSVFECVFKANEQCFSRIKRDKNIRLVGYLRQDWDSVDGTQVPLVQIIVEHIDSKY